MLLNPGRCDGVGFSSTSPLKEIILWGRWWVCSWWCLNFFNILASMYMPNDEDLLCIPYFVSIKTDHTAVILPSGMKLKPIRQNVCIRDCRRHRKEGLYLKLVSENWDSALNLNDVEEAVNNLEAKIKHHMDECMPLWSVHMSSRDRVWMTPLVKSLMRVKSRIAPSNKYRLAEVNRKISELISKNWRTLAKAPVGSREWWKHVDNLSQQRSISANMTLDAKSLEKLNDYFADLCTDDAYMKPVPAIVDKSLEAPQISERHVWNCLQHLKKTAMGPDLIPFWIWRDHAEIFTSVIHKIWNVSLKTGKWSSCGKGSMWRPSLRSTSLRASRTSEELRSRL